MSKYLAIIKNNNLAGLISVIDTVGISPILKRDGTNIGNTVMSLGDIRFTITRIYIDDNPNTSKRALCIEWNADGIDYKSYIDVNFSMSV